MMNFTLMKNGAKMEAFFAPIGVCHAQSSDQGIVMPPLRKSSIHWNTVPRYAWQYCWPSAGPIAYPVGL